MASPSLAPTEHTPANLAYTRDDILEAQDVVAAVLEYSTKREKEICTVSRYGGRHPPCPSEDAVARVLESQYELEDNTKSLVLREFQRRGHIDLCLAAYDWFLGHCETPMIPRFYDAAMYACASHFSKLEKAKSILDDCVAIDVKPSVLTYNMLITTCSHSGQWEEAFGFFERMVNEGVRPNTFTVDLLIRACNFKRYGNWERAMSAVAKLQELSIEVSESLVDSLLDVSSAAMHRATRWQDAMAVFVGLQRLGLECNPVAFNSLLKACAKDRAWEKAIGVFEHMVRLQVPATTETYNHLIQACHRGSQADKVLEVFEWMVEGRGTSGPITADTETYDILIAACHERGLLEKAFEILAWMDGSKADLGDRTYEELLGTLEVAEMWDKKDRLDAMDALSHPLGITKKHDTRLTPFDGMRMLYIEHEEDRFVEELLAREKLGMESWAPSAMRPAPPSKKKVASMRSTNQDLYTIPIIGSGGPTMLPPDSARQLPPLSQKRR